jgi:hypothetical protein
MEKQTKILLGVAAAGVVAFLVLKPKKATAQTNTSLGRPSTTKADSSNIIDNVVKKVTDVVKTTTSTTTRTTTTPPDVVRGTIKSPYLREGVEYIRSSDGAIAYADETSGRFNSVDPSHGNPWSQVNADPLFWEDTDIDWVNIPLDAFAGQGWGGRFSEGSQA